ncbi:hypothetical protein HZH68_006192 [Vespula germanica]|uniref:KIF-binding protein n=1 Tax=Vespula germanica TaxID=30212 RepID=A0A834NDG2_VESGE|nr:hypothetical protein HZH68_006192 [Vespula germanica]
MSFKFDKDLSFIIEQFTEVRRLLDEHEKAELTREPYKSKYAAIDLLKKIELNLNNTINTRQEEKDIDLVKLLLAITYLNRGILHVDIEELKTAEEQFMKCDNVLKGKELEPGAVLSILATLNQLGIVWSQWNEPAKAKIFLDRAEQVYKDFKDKKNSCDPIDLASNFGIGDSKGLNTKHILEKIHTLTLYYQAQVYGALKNYYKSAVYCHITLRRQLEQNEVTQDLDYVEWALNAATLSQYFIGNKCFTQARHHLVAASYILQKYENMMKEEKDDITDKITPSEYERFKHRSADIARCWAKYGILLLSLSKHRLIQEAEKEINPNKARKSKLDFNSEKDSEKSYDDLQFNILMDDIKPFINQITDKYVLDFNDAKPVFLNIQKWLEQAKSYYTLENHASDYVEIIQDISQAYKYLSFFEENEDRQAKMHKRRIDILEATVKELNPQYYKTACRQIWTELSETYSDILDIKMDRLQISEDKADPHALIKINHLAKSSIKNFQLFLDSLETNSTDAKTVTFPHDLVQPALGAYFQIGRLYGKIITFDKSIQLKNIQNTINAYQFLIDYCETHPEAAEIMKQELSLCKELVDLLPMRVCKLRQELLEQ